MSHTGERLTEGHSLETEVEHLHRYYLARQLCRGVDVLDIACGEGYGSAMLAQVARSVVGVDLDADAVAHAAQEYQRDGLSFRAGSATAIPLPDASVDVLVSFETLEHFVDHDRFLQEALRVLRPGGRLLLSTPDRDVFSPAGQPPVPYHLHELTAPEFRVLLRRYFPHTAFYAQRVMAGSAIVADAAPDPVAPLVFERRGDAHVEVSDGLPRARYVLCVASRSPHAPLPTSLLVETANLSELAGQPMQIAAERDALLHRVRLVEADLAGARLEIAAAADAARAERAKVARIEERAMESAARDAAEIARLGDELLHASTEWRMASELAERLQAERVADRERERGGLARSHALEAEGARLRTELQHRTLERDGLRYSTIWRATAPLRRVAHGLAGPTRQVRRSIRLLRLAARGDLLQRLGLRRRKAAEIALVTASGAFDRDFYLRRHPDLAAAGADPVAHYVWVGAAAGFDPAALFDTAWYAARHPALAATDTNPLAHYIREGAAAGHDPHPLFDSAWYGTQAGPPAPGATPLAQYLAADPAARPGPNAWFDPVAYRREYPEADGHAGGPLLHYFEMGAALGYDPHPLFDTDWYAARHPDAGGRNPLAHYLADGRARGLPPCPMLVGEAEAGPLQLPRAEAPAVSIVVPAYAHLYDTWRCLYALMLRTGDAVPYEVIVADDNPAAPIAPALAGITGLDITVNAANIGFVRSCNGAARRARGRAIVFLNNDTIVGQDWLAPMVRLLDDARVGIVGCKLLNADGTLQEAGGTILRDGWGVPYGLGDAPDRPEYNFVRDVDVVVGACFLVRADLFRQLRGFDDRYAPAFYEEFDLAFAARAAGYRVLYQPLSEVTHLGAASYGAAERDRQSVINHRKFCRKWLAALAEQPPVEADMLLARERPHPAGCILVIDDQVPEHDKHAGALAIQRYLHLLAGMGLKVFFYPYFQAPPPAYTRLLQQDGIEVLHGIGRLDAWIRRAGHLLDVVWTARPDVTEPFIDVIKQYTGARLLYLTHDLHYLRERRRHAVDGDEAALAAAQRYQRIETRLFREADRVLTFSQVEAAEIVAQAPGATVQVIPLLFFDPRPAIPRPPPAGHTLLFVGGFAHVPNVDAAVWLVETIMPLVWQAVPDAQVLIVGSAPPPEIQALARDGVEVTGFVPDVEPLYARARLSISPLRYGAGVKGKVVSSLAAGVPVVTTSVGNEGLDLRHGADALIADDAGSLAQAVVTLLTDDALGSTLSGNGYAVLNRRFSTAAARAALVSALGLPDP